MSTSTAEYGEALARFQSAVLLADEARNARTISLKKADEELEELKRLREEELERILKEKGLAVCSNSTGHLKAETEEEMLGIFPKGEMRLLYTSRVVWRGSEAYEHLERETKLRLLCPLCFPIDPNQVKPSKENLSSEKSGLDISSEVVEIEGKLVTVVNNIDVTDLPTERYLSEEVYSHFGLSALPESPK